MNRIGAGLIVLVILMTVSTAAAGERPASERIVLDMAEAINNRDLDSLDELVAPNVRRHCAATPGVVVESLEQFKAFLEEDFAAVPDSTQTVDMIFSAGDKVAMRAIYRGTQSGWFGPYPPSGKKLELPFIGILRLENGKVAEIWVEWDNLNALAQLGHYQPPGRGPEGGSAGD